MDKVTIIGPNKILGWNDLVELWEYRELLLTLVVRNFKIRYKQTEVGTMWAVMQPLLTMVVFSMLFGKFARIPSDGVPYPIFSYSGLLLWTYFSSVVTSASNSLVGESGLISKVYFPRMLLPLATTLTGLIDYTVAAVVMVGLMVFFQISLGWRLIGLIGILSLTFLLASGVGLWLSSINVRYRDVRYVVPFFLNLVMFLSPVIYPVSMTGKFKWLVSLNPLSGLIQAHRVLWLEHQAIDGALLATATVLTLVIAISGASYFKIMERKFADEI